jgi:hypothetical protein
MRAEAAERLLEPIASAVLVLAPSLYASEVANALWKYDVVKRKRTASISIQPSNAMKRRSI